MQKDIILLSIKDTYRENMSELELYEATNFAWNIDFTKNNSIKYAFAIFEKKVIEVYEIKNGYQQKKESLKQEKLI